MIEAVVKGCVLSRGVSLCHIPSRTSEYLASVLGVTVAKAGFLFVTSSPLELLLKTYLCQKFYPRPLHSEIHSAGCVRVCLCVNMHTHRYDTLTSQKSMVSGIGTPYSIRALSERSESSLRLFNEILKQDINETPDNYYVPVF